MTVPLFIIMLALMFIQVIFRYILEIPLAFSEELCRFLFVACTFLGAAIATAERGHIEINFTELAIVRFIKDRMGQMRAAVFMNVIRDLGTIICLSLVAFETYRAGARPVPHGPDIDSHGDAVLDSDRCDVPRPRALHPA